MSQKNASPRKGQTESIKAAGLNHLMWVVLKELRHKLIVKHRINGEVKVIDKAPVGLKVLETLVPDPDSQWRLRLCGCGFVPVYQKLENDAWRVCCEGCGKTGRVFGVRHDAQINWNKKLAGMPMED